MRGIGKRALPVAAMGVALGTTIPAAATQPVQISEQAFEQADAPRSRPDPLAVRGGLVLFSAAYAPMLGVATCNEFERPTGWLAVPVAGPFVLVPEESWPALADGLLQVAGVSIVVAGFAYPRRTLGPADRVAKRRPTPHRRFVATVGHQWVGVGGSF